MPVNTVIKSDRVEQDANEWWERTVAVMRKACLDESLNRGIEYLTVTSSSACLVPLEKGGKPLYNVLMVSDKRAVSESAEIEKNPAFKKLQSQNDYEIAPYYMLPKLLWLKNNEEKIFKNLHSVTTPNGYLLRKITGEDVIDVFDAEKFYFATDAGYPEELCESLGLSGISFPRVERYGHVVGKVTEKTRDEFGLINDVKVVLSSYDAICAFYGCGALEDGECCDVSGTVTSVRVMCGQGNNITKRKGIFIQSEDDGRSIVGGSNNLGGGVAEWLRQGLYPNETHPYEVMETESSEVSAGARGLVFLPYLMGERAPIWNDNARGVFFGIERHHTRADFARAVFEGIGFSVRSIVELVEQAGASVGRVRVSGGLARIHTISRIKADILNREVMVLEELETTSLGALMIMTVSAGLYASLKDASSSVVRIREVIFPNAETHDKYTSLYGLSQDLYSALVPVFEKRIAVNSLLAGNLAEEITNL